MWEQLALTSEGAIGAVHVRLELEPGGWVLWIMHRHVGGKFTDCRPDEYEALSFGEAMDVLEATVLTFGHP